MTPFPDMIRLSSAMIRFTGYSIEANLRIAQEFRRASFEANPFVVAKHLHTATTPVRKPAASRHQARKAAPKSAQKPKALLLRILPDAPAKADTETTKTPTANSAPVAPSNRRAKAAAKPAPRKTGSVPVPPLATPKLKPTAKLRATPNPKPAKAATPKAVEAPAQKLAGVPVRKKRAPSKPPALPPRTKKD